VNGCLRPLGLAVVWRRDIDVLRVELQELKDQNTKLIVADAWRAGVERVRFKALTKRKERDARSRGFKGQ
jgi:hypothetical protein